MFLSCIGWTWWKHIIVTNFSFILFRLFTVRVFCRAWCWVHGEQMQCLQGVRSLRANATPINGLNKHVQDKLSMQIMSPYSEQWICVPADVAIFLVRGETHNWEPHMCKTSALIDWFSTNLFTSYVVTASCNSPLLSFTSPTDRKKP